MCVKLNLLKLTGWKFSFVKIACSIAERDPVWLERLGIFLKLPETS